MFDEGSQACYTQQRQWHEMLFSNRKPHGSGLDLAKVNVVLELKEHFTLKIQTLPNPGLVI